jgi:ABC-type lipoprotein release transport system permease subunit
MVINGDELVDEKPKNNQNKSSTSKKPQEELSAFNYIMANFRRHRLRYGLTTFGVIVCVIFFIIIASLSIGLYERLEPETPTDEVTPEEEEDALPEDPEVKELDTSIKRTIINWLYFTSVLIFASAVAGVGSTMLMSITERKREIGILKSVGFTRRQIMELFLFESIMICFIGWLIGTIIGMFLANNVFNYEQFPGSNEIFFATMRTTPVVIFAAFIIVIVVCLLASIIPVFRAARLPPVEALKG